MKNSYDFSGWATKSNILCTDGRTIMPDAFAHNNGARVPLVWNHEHNGPQYVLGHADLENRPEGVYAYCSFNDTESGREARKLVQHGDVRSLSIAANHLKQQSGKVTHGQIFEVSLVLAGANPGARIIDVMSHGDEDDESAWICMEEPLEMTHADEEQAETTETTASDDTQTDTAEMSDKEEIKDESKGKTIGDVLKTMNEEQMTALKACVAQAIADAKDDNKTDKEEDNMKHNAFDTNEALANNEGEVLTHSDVEAIFADAKRSNIGSLREACLQHGVTNIEYLFPDYKNVTNTPGWIKRKSGWVDKVMSGVHHTPFSRIKSTFADITADEARAKGYIKGKKKVEEVFTLLKRTTDPQTIYKKQKLDRDDLIDITDFDAAAWIKTEMRWMLDEEIARAILIGDGRLTSSDDHIKHDHVRPIFNDDDLYTIKYKMDNVATEAEKASEFVDACVLAQDEYDGSGNPTAFMDQRLLTRCLLLKDRNGRRIYKDVTELATAMLVKEIVVVPVMKGLKDADDNEVLCVIVNLDDYNVGADKGGAVNMFDDFDIDYNARKYLIETRISGALVKPHSAVVITMDKTPAAAA